MIKLVMPQEKYKKQVMDFRKEFINFKSDMDGTGSLVDYKSYEKWLIHIHSKSKRLMAGKDKVPASTYLAIREEDDRIIGMMTIRHNLNNYLYNYVGHIGCCVRPMERQKGYAKLILKKALGIGKSLDIKRILLCCSKRNIASSRTILCIGGVLENEVKQGSETIQRYWINS